MIRINLLKFGNVNEAEIKEIIDIIKECYDRLSSSNKSNIVDLLVFESSLALDSFLLKEYQKLNIASSRFDDKFFAMHDAWYGIPRVFVCLERMYKLPKLVQEGGLRHEIAHTILHGSIEYYIIPMPLALVEIMKDFGLSKGYMNNILYLISIAVKDYEVARLLINKGYIKDQLEYANHVLSVSEDEMLSWNICKNNRSLLALHLISRLKDLCYSFAFISIPSLKEKIKDSMEKSLSYIQNPYSKMLFELVFQSLNSFSNDTISNINTLANSVANNIFRVLFKS
ncbi:MAG: hypothetical protein QXE19_03420 [Candidatus Bathyarchaeia archaeon]